MRFSAPPSALPRIVGCLLAAACIVRAEPVTAKPAISSGPWAAPIEKVYAPTDLARLRARLGRRVVLEGKLVAMGASHTGATTYLNFTKNYRDSVSLVFLGSSIAKGIPKEQLAALVGKTIHIGGLVEERNGALQMRVFSMEQIKVLP